MGAAEETPLKDSNGRRFTPLPLFIILFGIKTVSKTRFECRKTLIYKAFSTCINYSHSLKLVLYRVNSGLFTRFLVAFDQDFRFFYGVYEKTVLNWYPQCHPKSTTFPCNLLYHKIRINIKRFVEIF